MVTAATDTVDRVVGLETGADDYVVKPFNPRELVARITSPQKSRRMPPAKSGKELSAAEIDLLRRWVEQGAAYLHLVDLDGAALLATSEKTPTPLFEVALPKR